MEEARKASDAAEAVIPADAWPYATYQELLFLDSNQVSAPPSSFASAVDAGVAID